MQELKKFLVNEEIFGQKSSSEMMIEHFYKKRSEIFRFSAVVNFSWNMPWLQGKIPQIGLFRWNF